jgi:hypothetical protein
MSKTRAFIAGGIGTVALLTAGSLSASAAQSGDTTTTFTLNAGTIDIAVASNASLPNGNSGQPTVSGQLGPVNVTDNRGGEVGWTTSAASTVFTRTAGTATTSTSVSYNSGTINKTGTVTTTSSGDVTLSAIASSPVVTGTAVTGNNTASWDPTLTVNLPSDSLAGDYSGTVTTSVA